jgi:hypothetical protein
MELNGSPTKTFQRGRLLGEPDSLSAWLEGPEHRYRSDGSRQNDACGCPKRSLRRIGIGAPRRRHQGVRAVILCRAHGPANSA